MLPRISRRIQTIISRIPRTTIARTFSRNGSIWNSYNVGIINNGRKRNSVRSKFESNDVEISSKNERTNFGNSNINSTASNSTTSSSK